MEIRDVSPVQGVRSSEIKEKPCKVTGMSTLVVAATMIVFFLHTYLFSMLHGFVFDDRTWILKTPAWAAVWIFFFLSGVNIGNGFRTGRYKDNGRYTIKSIVRYYAHRVLKIAVPTWIFSVAALCVVEPELLMTQPVILLRIFTFTYGNIPASNAIGATWYVSTLMWLYFIAPFIMAFMEQFISKVKRVGGPVLWFVFLVLGFALRWGLYKSGADWSSKVYVPFYCNIDIYACGMLCSFIPKKKWLHSVWMKIIAAIVMIATLIYNIRIYYLGVWEPMQIIIYCYVMPTVYVITTTLFVSVYNSGAKPTKVTAKDVIQKPQLLINLFASISFEFYLVHSMVLSRIHPYIEAATPLRFHLKLLLLAFLISTMLAYLLHTAFQQCLNSKR